MVINNENGLTYKYNDVKELEEKMKRLFSDIELREKFGNNAKEFANKEYSPENYYKKLEKIYKNLIGVK